MRAGPPGQCRLLGGPPAWLAQVLLGVLALAALLYKRHREEHQRPIRIWGMDVSKQVTSMLVAHMCGMAIAMVASGTGDKMASECAWYFVAFSFDTTLGVALAIALHNFALRLARQQAQSSRLAACIAECGIYGDPPQWAHFWPQALEWTLAVLVARLLCGTVVLLLGAGLEHVAGVLDRLFAGHPTALLYFVMICCPLLMNLAQALIQDMALKWRKAHGNGSEKGGAPSDSEYGQVLAPLNSTLHPDAASRGTSA